MRKGTTLLLLAALALAAAACLPALGKSALAASLEPTDSGAPSAIVMFPMGDQPNPRPSAMAPVAFNHVIHEKWMSKSGKDCMVCHHTGDPQPCATCHTVQGSPKGGGITLYQAMHTEVIASPGPDKPSSCVSCHASRLKERDCAGCHTQLVKNPRDNAQWCTVCHAITPSMTIKQMQQGIENKLPESQNEKLAEETALARKQAKYWSPMVGPYKVEIGSLSKKYEPCVFNHRHHVADLMARIKDSKLAGAFHTNPATVCVTCHHNSPASAMPPKCSSCHSKNIDRDDPAMPNLMAAYHLQCMGCHTDMKIARPRNTDCATCHKLRPARTAAN